MVVSNFWRIEIVDGIAGARNIGRENGIYVEKYYPNRRQKTEDSIEVEIIGVYRGRSKYLNGGCTHPLRC